MTNTVTDNITFARRTMNREPIKVIADIITHEMNITPNRVFLFNDVRKLPTDAELFVVLDEQDYPPHGSELKYKETLSGDFVEVQTLNVRKRITISLISKNTDARTRQYEPQMALNSTYAQQKQEEYGFHVSTTSVMQNRSFLEATARLTRFDTEVMITTAFEKTQTVDYYNSAEHSSIFES